MALAHSPKIVTDGLVFYYDMGNPQKSWKGEPTTNLNRNSRDVSGTAYAPLDEWVSSEPTRFTKTYNPSIVTPLGTGATLLQESGINGYHHISRWGGAGISGNHALSCYVYPLANIDNFSIGLLAAGRITYNLTNRTISYSDTQVINGSGFIQDVPGYPGWLRIGGVINGRDGGWVGSMGLSIGSTYTGTSGGRAFYITGLQYETKTSPTAFIEAGQTRTNTQAILDVTNNNTITATSLTYASNNTFSFVRANSNYINISANTNTRFQNPYQTWSGWVNIASTGPNGYSELWNNGGNTGMTIQWQPTGVTFFMYNSAYLPYTVTVSNALNTWTNITCVIDNVARVMILYKNGALVGTSPQWSLYTPPSGSVHIGGNFATGNGGDYTQGIISNVQLYNKALTAIEIQQNFNALRGRYGI
jgi:hypothetical protein